MNITRRDYHFLSSSVADVLCTDEFKKTVISNFDGHVPYEITPNDYLHIDVDDVRLFREHFEDTLEAGVLNLVSLYLASRESALDKLKIQKKNAVIVVAAGYQFEFIILEHAVGWKKKGSDVLIQRAVNLKILPAPKSTRRP